MNSTQGMIPLSSSPDIKWMQSVDKWNQSDSTWKREGQTRLVSLVAGPFIALAGAVYNSIVIVIKLPVTTFRVLTGWIPTKEGHFRDDLPVDTSVAHMIWHSYKVVMCTADIFIVPVMGVIHPRANNWVHVKLWLSFVQEEEILKPTKPEKPKPPPKGKWPPQSPPLPQPTIDKDKIHQKNKAKGKLWTDQKEILAKRRKAMMSGTSSDSDDDSGNGLPMATTPDDTQPIVVDQDQFISFDKVLEGLVLQKKKLKKAADRVHTPKGPSPQDKRREEEQKQADAMNAFIKKANRGQDDDDQAPNTVVIGGSDDWGSDDDW